MKEALRKRGLANECFVDSFATSYEEIGNDVYPPMKHALFEAGIPLSPREAKHFTKADYEQADLVYYMDEWNHRNLCHIQEDTQGKYHPIAIYCPDIEEIEDPWYSHRFDWVVKQISRCVEAIIDHLFDSREEK